LSSIVDLLANPSKYQWIEVEADKAGYLDDIVAMDSKNRILAKQVKYSVHAGETEMQWSWQTLLDKPKPTAKSLLAKWASSMSILQRRGKILEACLVTNRVPNQEFAKALSKTGHVEWGRIPDASIKQRIVEQLGSIRAANAFFKEFEFRFQQPDLNTLGLQLEKKFYSLGGDLTGWLNLQNELRAWVREKTLPGPDGRITLETIRTAARWYALQTLPQDYGIPGDYVIPSTQFHQNMLSSISAGQEPCIVIEGSPGLGKSTYLSVLFKELVKKRLPVIRHHYFLSGARSIGRHSFRQVSESLMANLKEKYPSVIGALKGIRPNADQLWQWVEAVGLELSKKGQRLVIIVDGLDHVWREQSSIEDLDQLFEHLLPAPKGVVVVIGTQPVDNNQLPAKLLECAPRTAWRKLPALNELAVKRWLTHHAKELDLGKNRSSWSPQLTRLANSLSRKSQGHPLHLRYSLLALQEQGLLITEDNIAKLPACSHRDITTYYEKLWVRLPKDSQTILCLLAVCRFPWPASEISKCLPAGKNIASIAEALAKVRHLLISDTVGFRAFHGSLLVFVEARPEYRIWKNRILGFVRVWLNKTAPAYWKWAHGWLIEAELGKSAPLISGPNREWTINAIERRRQAHDTAAILARSAWSALQERDLPRSIEVGLLRDYYLGGIEEKEGAYTRLLYTQLRTVDASELRIWLHANLKSLNEKELRILAEYEEEQGNQEEVRSCVRELDRRWNNIDSSIPGEYEAQWKKIVGTLLGVAAFYDKAKQEVVVDIAAKNSGRVLDLTKIYTAQLRRSKRRKLLQNILSLSIGPKQRNTILDDVVLLAFDLGIAVPNVFRRTRTPNIFLKLHQTLKQHKKISLNGVQPPDLAPLRIPAHELYSKRLELRAFFYSAFFYLLLAEFLGKEPEINAWLKQIDDYTWSRQFVLRLATIAKDLANKLRSEAPVSFVSIYELLRGFRRPSLPEQRDDYECSREAARAVMDISFDLYPIAVDEQNRSIAIQDLDLLMKSDYLSLWEWLDAYLDNNRPWLTSEAVTTLLDRGTALLRATGEFTERADGFSGLAQLAIFHKRTQEASKLIRSTAENILTFRYHKDYLIFSALDSIEACYEAGIGNEKEWLKRLAVPVSRIEDFTDGDEVGALPRDLGELLVKIMPSALSTYHAWLCENEEYYDAQSVFHSYLENVDLSSPIAKELAATVCDEKSFSILLKRASNGDVIARDGLSAISRFMGKEALQQPEEKQNSGGSIGSDGDPVDVSSFPPENFKRYAEIIRNRIYHDKYCTEWVRFWVARGRGEDAITQVEKQIERGMYLHVHDVLFEAKLKCRGKEEAYGSLIKATLDRSGWTRYFYKTEEAIERWEMIQRYYPERWYQFLKDTLRGEHEEPWQGFTVEGRITRIVQYCIFMKQKRLAKTIVDKLTAGILDLVSPLNIETPVWVQKLN